jgi:hypothetical protein
MELIDKFILLGDTFSSNNIKSIAWMKNTPLGSAFIRPEELRGVGINHKYNFLLLKPPRADLWEMTSRYSA